jgi:hypothetical protein
VQTVEQSRTSQTEVDPAAGAKTEGAALMPFGGWERTPTLGVVGDNEALFRFPAPDDPAPSTARLLTMSLYAAALGLGGVGVGICAMVTVIGGADFWYVPILALFGLLSVALTVGTFLSIHRPILPWVLLMLATAPLTVDVVIAALY